MWTLTLGVPIGCRSPRKRGPYSMPNDTKGEVQVGSPHESRSTDAGHRDGAARSRGEGPVMGLDRRGVVIRLYAVGNPQGEDPHG